MLSTWYMLSTCRFLQNDKHTANEKKKLTANEKKILTSNDVSLSLSLPFLASASKSLKGQTRGQRDAVRIFAKGKRRRPIDSNRKSSGSD